jgi:hypothetical protein
MRQLSPVRQSSNQRECPDSRACAMDQPLGACADVLGFLIGAKFVLLGINLACGPVIDLDHLVC